MGPIRSGFSLGRSGSHRLLEAPARLGHEHHCRDAEAHRAPEGRGVDQCGVELLVRSGVAGHHTDTPKRIESTRLVATIHHEMSRNLKPFAPWVTSAHDRYAETRKQMEPTMSGHQIRSFAPSTARWSALRRTTWRH